MTRWNWSFLKNSGKNSVPRLKTLVKILSRNSGQKFPKVNFPGQSFSLPGIVSTVWGISFGETHPQVKPEIFALFGCHLLAKWVFSSYIPSNFFVLFQYHHIDTLNTPLRFMFWHFWGFDGVKASFPSHHLRCTYWKPYFECMFNFRGSTWSMGCIEVYASASCASYVGSTPD